jgi:Acetyltransferase (GNAT) domain
MLGLIKPAQPTVLATNMTLIEELLALDMLTLRAHTVSAGDEFNAERQRLSLIASMQVSQICTVRRNEALVAYAMLKPESAACWFVTGFNMHPLHRTAAVMREIFSSLAVVFDRHRITELRSHVYKTNSLSMSFHKRLGFRITRENDKAVEFFINVEEIIGWAKRSVPTS